MATSRLTGASVMLATAICVAAANDTGAQPAAPPASPPASAASPHGDMTELAKATQNPVSDLVSLPFQFNFNTGGDLEDRTSLNINFQPVLPFKLSDDWSMILRTILPIDSVPVGEGVSSGIGDIQEQVYLSPARPGRIIWGAGPVFSLPTATARPLVTGTWGVGPGVVVVKNIQHVVLGGLINQIWPMSDEGDGRETNQMLLQPFVNFNFGSGWAVAVAPIITANWNAPSGDEWTVPLGLGITRTTVLGSRPMNIGVQYYYNVERPEGAAANTLRFTLSLLFPKAHHASPQR